MFKKILYIIIPLLTFAIISCDKDDYTGDSTAKPKNSTATVTFDLPSEVEDKDTVFTYTVTIDPPQIVDLHIPVRALSDGTAVEGEDFSLDHTLVISALSTSATGSFTVINNCDIDEGETVAIEIGNSETSNINLTQNTYNINLNNYESKSLDIYATWLDTISVNRAYWNNIDTLIEEQEFILCNSVDIDMYLLDADGNNLLEYDGATGECVEHLVLQDLSDGVYTLQANLWSSDVPLDTLLMDKFTFPITVNFFQCGLFSETETQSEESAISNLDLDGGSVFKTVAEITVTSGNYTWVMR